MNLQLIIDELQKINHEVTRKELINLGLNDYYIKKICDNGILRKVGYGKYLVLINKESKENKKKRILTFDMFKNYVFNFNYLKAYEFLINNIKYQKDNKYHQFIYACLILLKEIIPSKSDDNILKKLDISCPSEKSSINYLKFYESLLAGKYLAAREYLDLKIKEEIEILKCNNINTLIIDNLLDEVIRIKENNYDQSINWNNYNLFIDSISDLDLERSIKYADACISTGKFLNVINMRRIKKIIIDIININKIDLPCKSIKYNKISDIYIKLNKSLVEKDYKKSLIFIEEIMKINNSEYFKILYYLINYLVLLNDIKLNDNSFNDDLNIDEIIIDFQNGNIEKSLFELKKYIVLNYNSDNYLDYILLLKLYEEYIDMINNNKPFNKVSINYFKLKNEKEIVTKAIINKDYQTALTNIRKCVYQNPDNKCYYLMMVLLSKMSELSYSIVRKNDNIDITDDFIVECIEKKEYSKLYNILEKKKKYGFTQLEAYTYRLINYLFKVKNNDSIYEKYSEYTHSSYRGKMYEAIRNGMIYDIKYFISQNEDDSELDLYVYTMLVDEIIYNLNENKNKKYNEIIKEIILKEEMFSKEEINNLLKMYDFKRSVYGKNIDYIIYDLIDIIKLINNRKLDFRYFESVGIPSDICDKELYYLENGDYLNAFNNFDSKESLFLNNLSLDEKNILYKLLSIFVWLINKSYDYKIDNSVLSFENEQLMILNKLKELIEKDNYDEAYQYYLDNLLSFDEIIPELLILKNNNQELTKKR